MKRILGLMMAMLMAMNASASLIVNYTGVTTGGVMRASDIDTDNGDTWNFSESVPLGTGTSTSSKIYGGIKTVWNNPTVGYEPTLEMTPTYGFRIYVLPAVYAQGTSIKAMLAWEKADFLAGSSQTVSFASGDTIAANFGTPSGTGTYRITVKQAGQWYVSTNSVALAGVLTIDPTVAMWKTITTDGTYTIGATASTLTLNDVEAVGVYGDFVRSNNASRFTLNSLVVNGSVIPEPATVGMMGLGGLITLLVRRQLRK